MHRQVVGAEISSTLALRHLVAMLTQALTEPEIGLLLDRETGRWTGSEKSSLERKPKR
jgi:hypothetical protein